ncbi:heterokaryon incompatibility protein-domain-containing protein [Podospora appendiculata]|uniref:Heterokaryon incompatibility protein-domain-containing protein n=1 Tax=Podospora appendiculata TaxID=314037 RepID=A0AAE1CB65_9PEZI|nr:heterokaryon incompatibility protein-domain-containing protein [Podospora appendiculata]
MPQDSPLCSKCQSLGLAAWLQQPSYDKTYMDQEYWHVDWLGDSATPPSHMDAACTLCPIIHNVAKWANPGASIYLTAFPPGALYQTTEDDSIAFGISWDGRVCSTLLELEAPNSKSPPPPVAGRLIDPSRVNFPLICHWLQECFHTHGPACSTTWRGAVDNLKVIDCATRNIIVAPPNSNYVALSYLWGPQSAAQRAEKINHDRLTGPLIPRVVEDALVATTALGIPYLWVDKYCINQAASAEKDRLIRQMDKIYDGAAVTLIAAHGLDAEAGLPGISIPRTAQSTLTIGNRVFLPVTDPLAEVKRSKWATRAWTYQEGLLSRRRLIFTPSVVYFQCHASYSAENMATPTPSLPLRDESYFYADVFPTIRLGSTPRDVHERITDYTVRELSFDADALNAIRGIFKRYEAAGVFHLWGLPFRAEGAGVGGREVVRDVAGALCWFTHSPGMEQRREGFPCWSWTGWKGLDQVVVWWAPRYGFSLTPVDEELDLKVWVLEERDGREERVMVEEYLERVRAGADFTDFKQEIVVQGRCAPCRVVNKFRVEGNLPPQFAPERVSSFKVPVVGVPEDEYGKLVDVYGDSLVLVYCGCRIAGRNKSSYEVTFCVLGRRGVERNGYERVGAVSVAVGKKDEAVGRKGYLGAEELRDAVRFIEERWETREFRLL